jgi:hypothetical protein
MSAWRIFSRRECLAAAALGTASLAHGAAFAAPQKLATFHADVTVPLDHGMMGGAWRSKKIADPLEAHGVVLLGDEPPIVLVSVDWCEIRNGAYAQWQTQLAEAAGTTPERVLVTTVHQHDAPVADLTAEALLRAERRPGSVCDPLFHDKAVAGVAKALKDALKNARPASKLGMGQAKVKKIASNRRYVTSDGAVHFDRFSNSKLAQAIAADEGVIDPWLKTLTFLDGDAPLASISFYAVHPMSYYGAGEVSADFPGIARRKRQEEMPGVAQLYCSGASGNVTAGKYNTGARENRPVLAERLHSAMTAAARDQKLAPLEKISFRSVPAKFEPRADTGFSEAELLETMKTDPKPFQQCLAAMGLSWRQRCATGKPIEIAAVDLGPAVLVLLPGEAYVEFQLAAQKMRPDKFVCVMGYGDGATGYIPTAMHLREKDTNLSDWCWVAPGAEDLLLAAMRDAMRAE